MRQPSNPFWRFSLRTYRVPGVQEACLTSQDLCGADVNLLLFCGWTGRQGRLLHAHDLDAAIDCVGAWQSEVITPVRRARRAIKQQPASGVAAALAPPLRRRLAALELDLERAEQALLADLYARWSPAAPVPPRQAIAANLARYLAALTATPEARVEAAVARIAQACSAGAVPPA